MIKQLGLTEIAAIHSYTVSINAVYIGVSKTNSKANLEHLEIANEHLIRTGVYVSIAKMWGR